MRCDVNSVRLVDLADAVRRHSGDVTKPYKTVEGEPVCLSCFLPKGYDPGKKKYPVFFFVHGGGWRGSHVFDDQAGWAGDYLGFLARYYADRGFFSVSIDYRAIRGDAQEEGRQLIDLYDDCMDALDFVAAEAAPLGLDPDRAALLGESAGGYLAAAMTTFPYRKNPFPPRLTVLVNAVTALSDSWEALIPAASSHPALRGLTRAEIGRALSPVCQVSERTGRTLLLHGEADTIVKPRHAEDYLRAMARAGRPAEICWLPDTNHAFLLVEYSHNDAAASAAIRRVDEELAAAGLTRG